MLDKNLQIQQLNSKMHAFSALQNVAIPSTGWVRAIRTSLGMSMLQLGKRLSISKQSVQDIEKREKDGSITLKALRETARVMDMHLVYGFVSKDGGLEALINRKANELASQIVLRTHATMLLEDKGISEERLQKAIQESALRIQTEMPKSLWD